MEVYGGEGGRKEGVSGMPLTFGSSDPPLSFPVGQAKTSEVSQCQTATMVKDVSVPQPLGQVVTVHSRRRSSGPRLPCHTP